MSNGRTIEEILFTGAVNSDESERVREAGYTYGPCSWCRAAAYRRDDKRPAETAWEDE